ncbi:MAG: GH3 auxin-responsive promoter family protein [Thermodesulfobacteriota bacterium]
MKSYVIEGLLNLLIFIRMCLLRHISWKPFIIKTYNPREVQNSVLEEILKQNKDTVFGKKYDFIGINSYDDFRRKIPVHTYEDLRSYIERQEETGEPHLTAEPTAMYALTSGTLGKPKYIPIHETMIRNFKKCQRLFSYALYSEIPSTYSGKVLAITGPAVEGYSSGGVPFGSLSGLLYKETPKFIKSKYIIPSAVFEIDNYDLKYFLICAIALSHKDITLIATANPSTILKLSEVINLNLDKLIQIIETGSLNGVDEPSTEKLKTIAGYFNRNAKRARELDDLSKTREHIKLKDIWPNIQTVVTWTSGSCSVLIPKLIEQLPDLANIVEMGYFASEFRGSIVIDVLGNNAVPAFHENFYEFVERDDWQNTNPNFLTLDQISEGRQYYILVTTPGGLYRYFINDIIEVTGTYNKTPMIKFVQKGKGVTNITGEKLYECQLNQAIEAIKNEHNLDIDFFIMIADPEALQYALYIEHAPVSAIDIESEVEKKLFKLNIEYEGKRKSKRLKPLRLMFLKPGTGEAYKKACVKAGQREGQYKLLTLQYNKECKFNFEKHVYL